MELLFANTSNHSISLPAYYSPSSILPDLPPPLDTASTPAPRPLATQAGVKRADVRFLIWWMRWYLLDDLDRPELFCQGESM